MEQLDSVSWCVVKQLASLKVGFKDVYSYVTKGMNKEKDFLYLVTIVR